jgi:hypothetical protein
MLLRGPAGRRGGRAAHATPLRRGVRDESVIVVPRANCRRVIPCWANTSFFKLSKIDLTWPQALPYSPAEPMVFSRVGDGTITVRVTGADGHDNEQFFCAIVATGDDVSKPANWVASSSGDLDQTIDNGEVTEIMVNHSVSPAVMPKIFTDGTSYDAGGLIDVDGNLVPSPGDYMTTIKTVVVDGNKTINFTFPDDFGLVP